MTYAEIVKNSLGGIMFWEITQDTTVPELSLLGRIHSLLKAQYHQAFLLITCCSTYIATQDSA